MHQKCYEKCNLIIIFINITIVYSYNKISLLGFDMILHLTWNLSWIVTYHDDISKAKELSSTFSKVKVLNNTIYQIKTFMNIGYNSDINNNAMEQISILNVLKLLISFHLNNISANQSTLKTEFIQPNHNAQSFHSLKWKPVLFLLWTKIILILHITADSENASGIRSLIRTA